MSQTLPPPAAEPYLRIRPSRGWTALNLRETWEFRDLLMTLAGRDLKLRYKQTALGVIWVVLQPLMAAGIFNFVFGVVAGMPTSFAQTYAGLLAWNLFSGTLTKTSGCLLGNSQLISKVYFPRLVLPLSTIPSTLVDFAVAAALMAGIMILQGIRPGWEILLLPVWMSLILMFAMGIGLWTSALMVSYRDVQYILPVLTQLLLYGSPVAYTAAFAVYRLSEYAAKHGLPTTYGQLFLLNPLATPLEAFRWSLLGGAAPHWGYLAYSAVVAVAFFAIGATMFKRMERKFADVI
jgi:lipopolysaccharide transport system permease protein